MTHRPFSKTFLFLLAALALAPIGAQAATDINIKDRIVLEKPIRTKMPPQLVIDHLRKRFQANSKLWGTSWINFVVEDDPIKDEFVIIARAVPRRWIFSLIKPDCPKPLDYDRFMQEAKGEATPVDFAAMVGVKRKRSWFRYVVTVYQPMYEGWKNPCIAWSLPAGGAQKDAFFKENYNTKIYAKNMGAKIYKEMSFLNAWKAPAKGQKIPLMKGSGEEILIEGSEELTDEERQLPLAEQEKLIHQRQEEKAQNLKKDKSAPKPK